MAAKVRDLDPVFLLKRAEQWSGILKYALEHPAFDKQGRLSFTGMPVPSGPGQPISRDGEPFACPRLANGMWSLEDLVTIAVLLRDVAREVGSHPVWREK